MTTYTAGPFPRPHGAWHDRTRGRLACVVVPTLGDVWKRLLLGRAPGRDRVARLLPKRVALPVYASDPLSSVVYATQEILVVLTLGGLGYLYLTPWVATAVAVMLVVVVASYRHLVRAYPDG